MMKMPDFRFLIKFVPPSCRSLEVLESDIIGLIDVFVCCLLYSPLYCGNGGGFFPLNVENSFDKTQQI